VLFLGNDWAEAHHDIELQDHEGRVLVRRRLPEGVAGLAQLHALIADHLDDTDEPESVLVGIETDRGPWVQAMVATGYRVYAINPMQVARYRERHTSSGAKSDPGDAHVLAEIVRNDRAHHRPVAGDSEQAEVIKTLARTHQTMIWTRQRQLNQLRSMLREFYPAALAAFGTDLAGRDALAVLAIAPTPAAGQSLSRSRIAAALRKAGRQRNIAPKAAELHAALGSDQLGLSRTLSEAYGASVRSLVAVIAAMVEQVTVLEAEVNRCFGELPDAEILTSQPGLGVVLGARVLAEFGDDKARFGDAKARRNYAGTSPITKASGTRRVVLARYARNKRLADALHQQAFAALTASPGARAFYDTTEPEAPPTTKPYAPCPTASSASSTAASATAPPTTKTPPGHTATPPPLDTLNPWDI
jgi:transposase